MGGAPRAPEAIERKKRDYSATVEAIEALAVRSDEDLDRDELDYLEVASFRPTYYFMPPLSR